MACARTYRLTSSGKNFESKGLASQEFGGSWDLNRCWRLRICRALTDILRVSPLKWRDHSRLQSLAKVSLGFAISPL